MPMRFRRISCMTITPRQRENRPHSAPKRKTQQSICMQIEVDGTHNPCKNSDAEQKHNISKWLQHTRDLWRIKHYVMFDREGVCICFLLVALLHRRCRVAVL